MRPTVAAALAASTILAACSRAPETTDAGAPDVPITAAPGVAFSYRYAFALPAERMAETQEAHARACESLGVERCRVTGFRYQVEGENSATGRLEMRLAPLIARRFGQQGVEAVRGAGGRLTDAEATGTDAGAEIDRLAGQQAAATKDARVAEARARTLPEADRRDDWLAQRDEALARQMAARVAATEQRRSLATTPVAFEYASGPGLPFFDTGSPLRSAAAAGLASARVTLAIGLGSAAMIGPPALLVLALLLIRRRLRPVWRRSFAPGSDPAPA